LLSRKKQALPKAFPRTSPTRLRPIGKRSVNAPPPAVAEAQGEMTMNTTRTILLAFVMLAGLGSYAIGDAQACDPSAEMFSPATDPKFDGPSGGNATRDDAPGSVGEAFRLGKDFRAPAQL
jgi:hypothetical protein